MAAVFRFTREDMDPLASHTNTEAPLEAGGVRITVLPALFDNYMYLLDDRVNALAIDPSEAEPVLSVLETRGLTLRTILNTHHHQDHVAGNLELKAATGCRVMGPDHPSIPGLDEALDEGDEFTFGPLRFQVLATPGHGRADLSFYVASPRDDEPGWLWCGDTLFCGGCGRLLGGTAEQMWASLSRLAALPDATRVCCGHEYTLDNLEFALSVDPGNADLLKRRQAVKALRAANRPSVPSTLGEEKKTNPFLRAGTLAIFRERRAQKDRF